MRYSQNNEQEVILNYFKDQPVGYIWDIGAYDGKTFSNTLALIEKGWSAAMIEGSPYNFAGLLQNTAHVADRCHYFLTVIGDYNGPINWYDTKGDAISTNHELHTDRWGKERFTRFRQWQITPYNLAQALPISPDFVNVDIEGSSAKVAYDLMFTENVNPLMWCIEHDSRERELRAAFTAAGYREILHNAENLIFVR